jgi:hypothetical protein
MKSRGVTAVAMSLAMALGAAAASSCTKTPNVSFELNVPNAVSGQVAWFEVGVFAGGACPAANQLAGGIAPDGTVTYLAFPANDKNPPGLGDLQKAVYGFAAVARAADCSVLATGCSKVDVNDARDISISLASTASPSGACSNGTVCQGARCVPPSDNSNPSLGAGCSLELVGAGPLADPLAPGTVLSPPVVTATDVGFMVAYREFAQGTARLTLIPIDNGGGAGSPGVTTLPGRCPDTPEGDGTAMAFNSGQGLVALARQPCGATAEGGTGTGGIDFFAVDNTGNVSKSGFSGAPATRITLASGHALAVTPAGILVAFTNTDTQTSYVAPVDGVLLSTSQSPWVFGDAPPVSSGMVAGADAGFALLALGTGGTTATDAGMDAGFDAGSDDGGGDGGGEGGPTEAGPLEAGASDATTSPDAGGPASTARLNTAATQADLGSLPPGYEFPATWASVAGAGPRIIVLSNGSSGKPLAWHAFDIGNATAAASGTFATETLGTVVYGDVAVHQDRVFFAVEVQGALSLFAFDHATTMPQLLKEQPFSNQSRISITDVRDGLVSVAASDTRVAVVWGTGRQLGDNDPVGGYAVFACTP